MNPHRCRMVLRPRDALEGLDVCLAMFRAFAGPYARLFAVVVVPLALGLGLASVLSGRSWWLVVAVVAAAPALQAPFTMLTGRLLFADDVRVRGVLWDLLGRAAPLLRATLTRGALALVPVLGAAGVWLPETALLERVSVRLGLERCWRLAGGHFGAALVGSMSGIVLTVWGAAVGESTGQAIVGFVMQLGEPFGSVWAGELTPYAVVGAACVQPLIAVYRLVLYVDVRTRLEGWDLQVALRAAGLARP